MEKNNKVAQFSKMDDKLLFEKFTALEMKLSDMMKVNIEELFEEREALIEVLESRGYTVDGSFK